jgi:hypothetical protein
VSQRRLDSLHDDVMRQGPSWSPQANTIPRSTAFVCGSDDRSYSTVSDLENAGQELVMQADCKCAKIL